MLVVHFYDQCVAALDKGAKVDDLIALPVREKIGRFKYTAERPDLRGIRCDLRRALSAD